MVSCQSEYETHLVWPPFAERALAFTPRAVLTERCYLSATPLSAGLVLSQQVAGWFLHVPDSSPLHQALASAWAVHPPSWASCTGVPESQLRPVGKGIQSSFFSHGSRIKIQEECTQERNRRLCVCLSYLDLLTFLSHFKALTLQG